MGVSKTIWTAAMAIAIVTSVLPFPATAAPQCNGERATKVGSNGPDRLVGTTGDDVIVALGGDDVVIGKTGDDLVCGGSGNDVLRGEDGVDGLDGGGGDDHLFGGADGDVLVGRRGADRLVAALGEHILSGGPGADRIEGGSGDDVVAGGPGKDAITGRGGRNQIAGGSGADRIVGGRGDGLVVAGGGPDRVSGGPGDDRIDGQAGADILSSGGGIGYIDGGGGADRIAGGSANDFLTGGDGRDRLSGASGEFDSLDGGDGPDVLEGGGKSDWLEGGEGDDELRGGAGGDTASFYSSRAGVAASLITGRARGQGADRLDDVEHLIGSRNGSDRLVGDSSRNIFRGLLGDDRILGGGGSDVASYSHPLIDGFVAQGIALDLAAGESSGHGQDFLASIESVQGSDQSDVIAGTDGPNRIYPSAGLDETFGRGGDDRIATGGTIAPGPGDDYVRGGPDTIVDFSGASGGISLDLETEVASGEGNDRIRGVGRVIGSPFDDELLGTEAQEGLVGAGGNDRLVGRGGLDLIAGDIGEIGPREVVAGNDSLDGGDGYDVLVYTFSATGISLDAREGTVSGEGTDTISGFEEVAGSKHDDVLQGSDMGERMSADAGNDRIVGLGGNDALYGGDDVDEIDGGDGVDACREGETVTNCELSSTGGESSEANRGQTMRASRSRVLGGSMAPMPGSTQLEGGPTPLREHSSGSVCRGAITCHAFRPALGLRPRMVSRSFAEQFHPHSRWAICGTDCYRTASHYCHQQCS